MAEIKRDWTIGDKFRVRSKEEVKLELDDNDETNGINWIDKMYELCGKEYEVWDFEEEKGVRIKAIGGTWSLAYEWIEPIFQYLWSKYVSME